MTWQLDDVLLLLLEGIFLLFLLGAAYGSYRIAVDTKFAALHRARRLAGEIQNRCRQLENQREDRRWNRILDDIGWNESRDVVKH